ncbi:MAG: hypothetical protein IPI52_07280 [Bacteroidetes bacterium]|nr:hypothetical protein [Bacteroidota bacterium]
MRKLILPLLMFLVLGNTFAQQIIIHPNWKIGEERKLIITTITPREQEDEEMDSEDAEKPIIEESLSLGEIMLFDTMNFKANWKVISKTDDYYEMEWQYTNFEMNRSNLDEYTMDIVKIYDALAKCPPVRYQMGLNGKFLEYSEENGLEQAIKAISAILNVEYEAPLTEEELENVRVDEVEVVDDQKYDDEGNLLDDEGNIIEPNDDDEVQVGDFSFNTLDFVLRSTMESIFSERIEKIHSFFGDTCKIGIKKDISELDVKELEDLEKMKGMFDIAGNLLVTEVENHYNYVFQVNMEMGDFMKNLMESFKDAFDEGEKGKKKKKKVKEEDLEAKEFLNSFQMNMAIDGEMNLSKNTFWPLDLFYTLTVKGNVMENKENKGFDVTSSEKIIFK